MATDQSNNRGGIGTLGFTALALGVIFLIIGIAQHGHYALHHSVCTSSLGEEEQAADSDFKNLCQTASVHYYLSWALIGVGLVIGFWGFRFLSAALRSQSGRALSSSVAPAGTQQAARPVSVPSAPRFRGTDTVGPAPRQSSNVAPGIAVEDGLGGGNRPGDILWQSSFTSDDVDRGPHHDGQWSARDELRRV